MALTFKALRFANSRRTDTEIKHRLDEWSIAEWGCAMAGECGEACNIAKKIIRVRDGLEYLNAKTLLEYKQELADELADMIIYADLMAARAEINLDEAIVKKFNEDSTKRNFKTKLEVT